MTEKIDDFHSQLSRQTLVEDDCSDEASTSQVNFLNYKLLFGNYSICPPYKLPITLIFYKLLDLTINYNKNYYE